MFVGDIQETSPPDWHQESDEQTVSHAYNSHNTPHCHHHLTPNIAQCSLQTWPQHGPVLTPNMAQCPHSMCQTQEGQTSYMRQDLTPPASHALCAPAQPVWHTNIPLPLEGSKYLHQLVIHMAISTAIGMAQHGYRAWLVVYML